MNRINSMAQTLLNPAASSRPARSITPVRRTGVALTWIVSLALVVMASIANANILAYEPFNYSVGGINNGDATTATGTPTATTGGGFTGTWFSGGAGTTIVGGLAYPGLQTANNALQWSTSVPYHGENLATAILPSTTPTVYVSFLYNAPSFTANKTGFALDNGASSNQGYYMGMTASGVFGVATVDNGSGTVLGTAVETINFNTTYFVVVKFDKDAAGTYYKSGSIWINPTPGAAEPAASGTFSGTYTAMNKIQDFLTALGGSVVITDEIRLGTTWADVTPANGVAPPAPPTGLQVDSVGANTVNLSWTASASGSPTSYNVKRAISSGGTYTIVGTTTAPAVSFTDSVEGGSTYYYVVTALSVGGESDATSYVSATPTLGVPTAPADLAANPADNQVDLTWTASTVGSPTSYNVKRSTTPGSGYTAITTPGAQTTTSYTDTTAVNGTTYYYVVSGVNATGEGANSTEANATPSTYTGAYEPFDYPVEDNLLSGTAATGAGFTSWNNGVAGWVVSGLNYTGLPVANNAMRSPATSRQSVGLAEPLSSGTRWISFLYKTSDGNSGANMKGVYFPNGGTGLFFGFGLHPFSAEQGYFALGSMSTTGTTPINDLSTTKLTELGLGTYGATYLVVLKIDFDTSGNNDTVTVYLNPETNQTTPGVPAAGSYAAFDVGTISGIGMQTTGGGEIIVDEIRISESYTDVVDAVTVPPAIPDGLIATPGANQVSLSWTAVTGYPTTYNVKRATSSGGPYVTIGSTTPPTVSYTDSILGGPTYYYVVSATNSAGESADSSYVSAAPILTAPDTPAGLSATPADSQVSLSWAASEFATSYDVKRADNIAGPYVSIDTTAALTYDDFGVNNAITYYYVVAAIGAGGPSSDTSPVSATPFGPLPLVLNIDEGVGITWFASNNITYQIQWTSEDLGTNTVWNNLGSTVIGSGTTNTVFDPEAAPEDLYQVISFE